MQINMLELIKELLPLNRSLTGRGNLETLKILKSKNNKLKIKSFKSGQKFFDWKIPNEWNIHDAYILSPDNKKLCDFKKNNLHVVSYSHKVNKTLNLNKLKKFLFTNPKMPNAIPYITSYYKKTWGFCMKYKDFKKLKNGKYKVKINSSFKKGKMHYGEIHIKGNLKREVLFSTYICHPSMANNELSGPVVALYLANFIKKKKRRYSYRFVFVPETIGSIGYISKNLKYLKNNIIAGYILTCLGDERCISYLPSRKGNTLSDRFALEVLKKIKYKKKYYTWLDRASDERQYCSPGVDLPICSIMKSKYGSFKEYHTSLDGIGNVVTKKGLQQSFRIYKSIIELIENSYFPKSKKICEPFMTKYNLYPTMNNRSNWIIPSELRVRNIMNFISWCDGTHSIEEISEKIKLDIFSVKKIYNLLLRKKLLNL